MIHPFKSLDHWASRSVARTALIMWLVAAFLGVFVVLSIVGEVWYTAPRPITHLNQGSAGNAPA